jgi:purine-cytosine permease-like protein
MSIIVGIVIVSLISWIVAVFGMAVFHHYERWAWIPQVIVLFVLVGSAGPKFDTSTPSVGNTETINANRLSFFSLCLSARLLGARHPLIYMSTTPQTCRSGRVLS